ncbi:MAG TPA: hypothetical protein VFS55_00975 [Dokdonella sp.]|nr:hypothetical protein [Dokdonella sp.]
MIIWANLDCEARWGGGSLPQHVARRVSAASALLAAFAPASEHVDVYAPAAVDPARIRLPDVTMHVGAPPRHDLAWADPHAKAANDRRLALAISEQLGRALPGARAIASLAELDAHLAATQPARWVCKAPWTAAGRDRAHGEGTTLSGELRVYVGRLIDRCGAVLYEPWLDRVLDLGVCAELRPDGRIAAQAPHTLLSDARGGFLGIDLAPPALDDADRDVLAATVDAAGAALHGLGYSGPFTIDAFVHRDGDAQRLHALCELNARHTFGHVARALAARFGTRVLGFGTPPAGARVLVAPGADDPVSAWVA